MDTSLILAPIIGIIFLVGGLQAVFNKKFILEVGENFMQNPAILWTIGFILLLIGTILVTIQNIWSFDWRVIITVIAWLTLIKGGIFMLFPNSTKLIYRKCNSSPLIIASGIVAIIIGLFFIYIFVSYMTLGVA